MHEYTHVLEKIPGKTDLTCYLMVYTIVIYSSSRVQGESRVERESGVERENRGGIVRGRERAGGGREQNGERGG